MNKHLNNWLDKVEGLPENTSNKNITKELAGRGKLLEKEIIEAYERANSVLID